MSYELKHRPKIFEEVYGNKGVVKSIQNLLGEETPPKSWLFYGMSGVGKTTIARILAKKVGASNTGLIEMNVADLRGIDAMREVVMLSQTRIAGSDVSVFILDECHQLTKEAQNLLLKVLEDTPKHAYFVLCTTEITGILKTIRTRCKEFQFKPLEENDMIELLVNVCEKEGLENIDNKIVGKIIVKSGGSARLALNLLEKISGIENYDESLEVIKSVNYFDEVGDFEKAIVLVNYLTEPSELVSRWKKISSFLKENLTGGKSDVDAIRDGVINLFGTKLLKNDMANKCSESIMLLENSKMNYSRASFYAVMYKVLKIFS